MRGIAIGAAALLVAAMTDAVAQAPVPGYLSEADGRLLVERLADTKQALGDKATIAAHFASLIEGPPFSERSSTVAGLSSIHHGAVAGVPQTTVRLHFPDMKKADAFRALVDKTFGPSDPACSNATRAQWSPEPGLSLAWRADEYDSVDAELSLLAADPRDANCARSSAPNNGLIDVGQMAAFFERLRDNPPPFQNANAMREWLQPYGEMESSQEEQCSAGFWIRAPSAPSGIAFLNAALEFCAVVPTDKPSTLFISAADTDMFGQERTAEALNTVFGPKHEACSDEYRDVWAVSDDTTLVLTPLYPSFGILIVNGPVTILSDCS